MEKILFICDAACDLSRADVEGKNIEIMPVNLVFGGQECREFYDITPAEFWKVLEEQEDIPVTQQVTPLTFLNCYKRAMESGYTHIVAITISSTASGASTSAAVALDMLKEEQPEAPLTLAIIDSLGYSMMYGQLLLEGCRQAEQGRTFDEIVADLRDRASRAEAIFLVYSLKHIRKSGRISGMSAFIGGAMAIRPILRCLNGRIDPIDKVRGDKKLIPRMLELVGQYIREPEKQTIIVVRGDLPDAEIELCERSLRETLKPAGVMIREIGPSVATNTGPYCLGVIYFGEKRETASKQT